MTELKTKTHDNLREYIKEMEELTINLKAVLEDELSAEETLKRLQNGKGINNQLIMITDILIKITDILTTLTEIAPNETSEIEVAAEKDIDSINFKRANCLKRYGIIQIKDLLVFQDTDDIRKVRNLGAKSCEELISFMRKLDMPIVGKNLEESMSENKLIWLAIYKEMLKSAGLTIEEAEKMDRYSLLRILHKPKQKRVTIKSPKLRTV